MADRAAEIGERLGLSPEDAGAMCRACNVRRTNKVPRFGDGSLQESMDSYVQPLRLTLHYTTVAAVLAAHPGDRGAMRVVDYGCGLAFAPTGFRVALVDLADALVPGGHF